MSCYEKISEVGNRRPKVLYHYGVSEANAPRPGAGRLWAPPYSSAPDGWAYKPGVISGSLRMLRTGWYKPFDPKSDKGDYGGSVGRVPIGAIPRSVSDMEGSGWAARDNQTGDVRFQNRPSAACHSSTACNIQAL